MQVFLSYSHTDKNIAAKLRRSLEEKGLSFNDAGENAQVGTSWRQQIEGAIRSSDAIILLLSSRQRVDDQQQLTWRLALETVWADTTKRLIPILLQEAELPAFVRSGASGDSVQAIRIREPKDLVPAAQAILRTLGVPPPEEGGNGSKRIGEIHLSYDHLSPKSLKRSSSRGRFVEVIENYPAVTDDDRAQRRERLSAIQKYAEQLKN